MLMIAPSGRNSFSDCAFTSSSMPAARNSSMRPQVEVRRPGQRRSAAKSLDNERRHAVLREEHRRGEPDEPSAGDDDRELSGIFSRHTPKNPR